MYYLPYMLLRHQLIDHHKAKLIIEGVEVYFEAHPVKEMWTVRAHIDYAPEVMTASLKENLLSLNQLKLHRCGGCLKAYPEEGFVVFSQPMKVATDFLLFKAAMKEFMATYDLWKSVVEDMMKSEGLLSI